MKKLSYEGFEKFEAKRLNCESVLHYKILEDLEWISSFPDEQDIKNESKNWDITSAESEVFSCGAVWMRAVMAENMARLRFTMLRKVHNLLELSRLTTQN